jgi:hypothetical protein
VLPGSERTLELRLRLVDLVDGSVLAEQTLSLPVVGATPTPPPTVPPPPTRTPVVSGGGQPVVPPPVIDSLTVSPNPVDRGGTVTVSWVVQNAASVTVYRANPAGQFADFLTDQPLVGSWTLPLPDYHVDSAVFYVWAEGPDGTQVSASVTVQVNCPYTYFFGEPDPSQGCPLRAAISVQAALQPFQNGYMIWRGDVAQIYVLSKSGSVNRFQDTWAGEAITFPEAPPSPDLIQPARGFGKVWTENAWVRDQLGWATGPEQGYTMQVQSSGAYRYPYLYMTWPDGRVFYVVETQWSFLN